ncbi:nicotinate-nucleotide adenylyltransferase [Brevibacillus centrosporus]|uniref:nicotinate-nucleotide adenylyltransferase n=1 Tax=Brevibacillus centrosporus TaxID=54910 RepID=UPI000F0A2B5B|nr:nicotinate-nucleotide adenylyltransferase [Brevibacillus centrosporus]MEC2130976.1 nicotinate-nucleotide adenylyltransferase [Brevibacillus centrosporus]RNB63363.1 nicotinate-nucleotide adenylyltransferase [Brevibacillus centrosporus]GED31311.1 nicotinate-nucleotide adenylyltransferase [Brevibacillus centrosporus]
MDERIKHVGILGGTFDPIHCGHLLAAEQAREQAGLDEVWFMPTHIPPHKTRDGLTDAATRLEMVELAVADHESFRVTDVELRREGPSYTYDTIVQLVEQYPDCRFSFIIGGDMVEILPKWYRFEELSRMIRFIGLARPGADIDRVPNDTVTFIEMPVWDISSTLIRMKAAEGQSIRYLVPRSVERYIKENGFYA